MPPAEKEILSLLGTRVEIEHLSIHPNGESIDEVIAKHRDHTAAFAVNGITAALNLGRRRVTQPHVSSLFNRADETAVVDGEGVASIVERWSVQLANEIEPGIWANKKVLMLPGLNHVGLTESLKYYTQEIRFADAQLFLDPVEQTALKEIGSQGKRFEKILETVRQRGETGRNLSAINSRPPIDEKDVAWADIIAGDIEIIRKLPPQNLSGKSIVTPYCLPEDVEDLKQRNVSILMTLMPNLSHDRRVFARHTPAELEACLAALMEPETERSEHSYIRLLSDLKWKPAIRYLQPDEAAVNIFSYVNYPGHNEDFAQFKWMEWIPNRLMKQVSRHIPPVFLGQIKNFARPDLKRQAVGDAFWIGSSPQQLLQQETETIIRSIQRIAYMSEQLNARMLGTATRSREIVAALDLVKAKTDIGLSSGEAYTIISALDFGITHLAALRGIDQLSDAKAIVINSDDVVCQVATEYLAGRLSNIELIGAKPKPLMQLKKDIEEIHSDTNITISTAAEKGVETADFILIGRTQNRFQPTLDISCVPPGAIICDLGQPALLTPEQAMTRPDTLIIESGLIEMPVPLTADFKLGHSLDKIPAALAEAALLTLESRFADFGLLSELDSNHLYVIRDLAQKHNFKTVAAEAFGYPVTREQVEHKIALAQTLRQDPQRLSSLNRTAEAVLERVEKRTEPSQPILRRNSLILTGLGVVALFAGLGGWFVSRRRRKEEG